GAVQESRSNSRRDLGPTPGGGSFAGRVAVGSEPSRRSVAGGPRRSPLRLRSLASGRHARFRRDKRPHDRVHGGGSRSTERGRAVLDGAGGASVLRVSLDRSWRDLSCTPRPSFAVATWPRACAGFPASCTHEG